MQGGLQDRGGEVARGHEESGLEVQAVVAYVPHFYDISLERTSWAKISLKLKLEEASPCFQ